MKKRELIKKLNEDDMMEILIENFQTGKLGKSRGYGQILGTPGKDLRGVFVITTDFSEKVHDIEKLDKEMDFNGDHSVFDKHPEFIIDPTEH